jgi:hypothetical protein
MTEKKVTLAKTEYDAMEAELRDLRIIVDNRTVVKIIEENTNWYSIRHTANGVRIKYVVSEKNSAIDELAKDIEFLQNKLQRVQGELDMRNREVWQKADEIKELKAKKWYHKLFNK